jgi:hypothetical protein
VYVPSTCTSIVGLKSAGVKYEIFDDGKALNGNVYITQKSLGDSTIVYMVVNGVKFGFAGNNFEESDLQNLDFGIDYFCFENNIENEYIDNFVYEKKSINCR